MVCCLSFIEFFSPSNDAIPVGARRLLAQTTISLHWIYSSNVSRKKQSEKMPPSRLHIPTHILSTSGIRFLSIHRNLIQIHLQRLSAHSHQTSLTQRCHRGLALGGGRARAVRSGGDRLRGVDRGGRPAGFRADRLGPCGGRFSPQCAAAVLVAQRDRRVAGRETQT